MNFGSAYINGGILAPRKTGQYFYTKRGSNSLPSTAKLPLLGPQCTCNPFIKSFYKFSTSKARVGVFIFICCQYAFLISSSPKGQLLFLGGGKHQNILWPLKSYNKKREVNKIVVLLTLFIPNPFCRKKDEQSQIWDVAVKTQN